MTCVPSRTHWGLPLVLLLGTLPLLEGTAARATQPPPTGLPDTLTFERATALLLDHNPQLRGARAQVRAQSQSARADALYPNPSLEASEEWTPLPGDGTDDQWYLSLSQPLNYPGEQRARHRSADAARTAAEAALQETRSALYNTLRHRYLDVAVAQARRRVHQRYTAAVRRAARAGTVRYEEGDLGAVQRARLRSTEAQFESDRAQAEQRLRTARTELAYTLLPSAEARRDSAAVPLYGVPDSLHVRPLTTVPERRALRRAREQRPRLQAQRARVRRETQSLRATRYRQYPDLTLSAGPKRQSVPGGTTYGFTAGLQVTLPVWNGGRTAVAAQEGRRSQAQARLDAARRTVMTEVRSALDRLASHRTRLQSVADTILSDAGTPLDDALFAYEQGQVTLFELLDAIEAARQSRLLRVRLSAQYLRALYDLEAALGIGPTDDPLVVDGALHPRDPTLE